MKEQTERGLVTPGLVSEQEKGEAGEAEVEIKREVLKPPPSLTPPALPVKLGHHSKSPFFPHSPKLESELSGVSIGSPLQRMANITNSLVTTPPSVAFGSPARSNFKSVLPPITQQQFDR